MKSMSKQCDIVRDILPLYVDGACRDVYKRQLTATPAATVVINTTAPVTTTEKVAIATDNVPEGATETNADGTAVSYTHLDVYKRQVQSIWVKGVYFHSKGYQPGAVGKRLNSRKDS